MDPIVVKRRKLEKKMESITDAEGNKRIRETTFIGVHLGAGEHSERRSMDYRKVCNDACKTAMKVLNSGGSSADAVVEAVKIIENSRLLNAGSGSNLTLDGTVECDAGFMSGDGYFGGVGAVPGVPNPVMAAKALADTHRREKLFSCGRVPPNFIVGPAAKSWASSVGIQTCPNEDMISDKAKKTYEKYIKKIEAVKDEVTDTVGAVALDSEGHVASAVSSGGYWLKFPGRIGHSPIFGCGCYSTNLSSNNHAKTDSAIAVSTSGSGEMISRVRLAQGCAEEALRGNGFLEIPEYVKKQVLDNHSLDIHSEPRYVGLIALSWDGEHGEFSWTHSSRNFVVGYLASNNGRGSPEFDFSQLAPGALPGQAIKTSGTSF